LGLVQAKMTCIPLILLPRSRETSKKESESSCSPCELPVYTVPMHQGQPAIHYSSFTYRRFHASVGHRTQSSR